MSKPRANLIASMATQDIISEIRDLLDELERRSCANTRPKPQKAKSNTGALRPLDYAVSSWVIRGKWPDGFKIEFGASPDSPRSGVYRNRLKAQQAMIHAERMVRQKRLLDEPDISARMHIVAARIDDMQEDAEERHGAPDGANAFFLSPPG